MPGFRAVPDEPQQFWHKSMAASIMMPTMAMHTETSVKPVLPLGRIPFFLHGHPSNRSRRPEVEQYQCQTGALKLPLALNLLRNRMARRKP